MNYAVVFVDHALDDVLDALVVLPDEDVRFVLLDELERRLSELADDPIRHGERIPPEERFVPLRGRCGMRLTFWHPFRDVTYAFAAYYFFDVKEEDICVYDVVMDVIDIGGMPE
jgi:hypothetical protein